MELLYELTEMDLGSRGFDQFSY